MDKKTIYNKYNEIFDSYPHVELEEHIKKLIEFDSYYPYNTTFFCITNTVTQNFEYISKNFNACTGLSAKEMQRVGMDYFWSRFHPDDIAPWIQCLQDLMSFTMSELTDKQRKRMSYTWNYRMKNGKDDYVTVIQNTTPLQFDSDHKPIIGLAHYTILNGHVNIDICPSAKYLNEDNEYETLYFSNITSKNLLSSISHRERDIIRLLLCKKSSKEIAESLSISKHTVDTHRRNILKKFNLISTGELISYFKNNINLL